MFYLRDRRINKSLAHPQQCIQASECEPTWLRVKSPPASVLPSSAVCGSFQRPGPEAACLVGLPEWHWRPSRATALQLPAHLALLQSAAGSCPLPCPADEHKCTVNMSYTCYSGVLSSNLVLTPCCKVQQDIALSFVLQTCNPG